MNVPYIYEIEGEYFTALNRAVTYLLIKYSPEYSIKESTISLSDEVINYVFVLTFEDIECTIRRTVTRHKLNKDYEG